VESKLLQSEMIDRFTTFDGWTVQVDREEWEGEGMIRIYLYVFHEHSDGTDDYMKKSVDMITLDTAYACMGGFLDECRREY
jgi:hypothetical protein